MSARASHSALVSETIKYDNFFKMSKQIKHLLYALPLLMAVGCDTTEEAFLVGSAPKEENFLNVDKALLSFTPEGGT